MNIWAFLYQFFSVLCKIQKLLYKSFYVRNKKQMQEDYFLQPLAPIPLFSSLPNPVPWTNLHSRPPAGLPHPHQSREISPPTHFSPHSSHCPNLQLQQASPGHILGEPGREASGPVKRVLEILKATFPPFLPINPSLSYPPMHQTASWGLSSLCPHSQD